jgi:rieske iron-sulfur protein
MTEKNSSDNPQPGERDGCSACPRHDHIGRDIIGRDFVRRDFIKWALAAGAGLSVGTALADDSAIGNAPPQADDRFVFSDGDRANTEIALADLVVGAAPIMAWPMEPKTKTVRNGSRLNQVLLLRIAPAELDEETRAHSAEGVVAYSAICKHAQCPVTGWIPEKQVLHCYCHDSQYDPRHNAKVVFGPAPRSLPALPVKIADGVLLAAGTFLGKVGQRQT